MFRSRFWSVALLVIVGGVVAAAFMQLPFATWSHASTEPKVFGAPPARVIHEDYEGAPAAGETLTHVPNLSKLAAGNRTHQVRIDIVAQEIEIAPGRR